ncbi:rifamycin-inactivating phosphotransferase [Corallococcus sp. M7]
MPAYALGFQEVDRTRIMEVGGKGASLGELSRMEGVHVPDGFCVSTEAFKRILGEAPTTGEWLERLSRLKAEDRGSIREVSAALRAVIEGIAIPEDVQEAITLFLSRLGERAPYAVRSSATAEDLPTASFAGQQDTYLNVIGKPEILTHIRRCWASLFTERAVAYRIQHGFDHRKVHMAVVVQKMVAPQAAGTLFTADPVTSNRKVSSIEATFGLGEALVSGLVNADGYKVRNGQITEKTIATTERQTSPVLTDAQIVRLERLGRRIEAHFGHPQDIEWCLLDDTFYLVQSRPITTLYPIPDVGDGGNHIFVSVGHQQMMTDPMKPLGLSLWQLTAARPMYAAGGRLFVDCMKELASPASREAMLDVLGRSEPIIRDALETLIARGDFIQPLPSPEPAQGKPGTPPPAFDDPAVVADLIAQSQAAIETLKQNIQTKSGMELLDFILEDFQTLRRSLFEPRSFGALMSGMNAASWLNEKMQAWLGEKSAADTLSQSVPNNITSEMGLALLDVADAIRPHPEVVEYLRNARDEGFLEGLAGVEGGQAAHDAISAYLDRFGMRCVGEIDVTRPRWRESPTTLVPLILGNIKAFEPGASNRKFEQGRQEALKKEQELLARLRQLPEGDEKAGETERMIRRLRNFIGYREYPKYSIVNRYFVYRQALLKEAERLVQARVLQEKEDIDSLSFQELREVVRTNHVDGQLIRQRKDEHERNRKLTPPRVITSDGEIVTGAYKRAGLPAGAIAGLAVSSGVVEGRARVLLDMADAEMEEGDILVTPFTDPSWTPLFVSIKGLVTEVGGLMTHGAVIAREYGLPAVVGVENATRRIQDGQRIRVHGTEGYVEVLS